MTSGKLEKAGVHTFSNRRKKASGSCTPYTHSNINSSKNLLYLRNHICQPNMWTEKHFFGWRCLYSVSSWISVNSHCPLPPHQLPRSKKNCLQSPNWFSFHFHTLEKEMATHCSVLAWRIPGTGEPGGLPSMGSHRVRHDWSDLAAARAATDSWNYTLEIGFNHN